MGVRVVPVPGAVDRLDTAPAQRRVAGQALEAMKQIAPVRTGKLVRSGHLEEGGTLDIVAGGATTGTVIDIVFDPRGPNGESYAGYVEKGTRYMDAQPFMLPAVSRRYE